MKNLFQISLSLILGFFVYNTFIKNHAEADAKKSYENYEIGKGIFIDVRERQEVESGMIKGALWFALSDIEKDVKGSAKKIKELSAGKEIYLYCRSGNRSGKVKEYLKKEGVEALNVGGFSSLIEQGLPTQPGPQ